MIEITKNMNQIERIEIINFILLNELIVFNHSAELNTLFNIFKNNCNFSLFNP